MRSSSCALDHTAHGVAGHALREVDGDRRTRAERLGETHVVVVEAGVVALLVVRRDDSDRAALDDERHVERRGDAEVAGDRLVDLRVVEDGVDALAPPALEDAPDLRAVQLELRPDHAVGSFAVGGRDAQGVARVRERDEHEPGVHELAQAASRHGQQRLELELGGERVADLVDRLELPKPAGRRLVQARVLDRDRGLRGEQLRELLVLLGEVSAALPSR